MSCEKLKTSIAEVDEKVEQLHAVTRDQATNNSVATTATATTADMSFAGTPGQLFGPLQTALTGVSSVQREYDTGRLTENLVSAKERRKHLTDIYNQRCS